MVPAVHGMLERFSCWLEVSLILWKEPDLLTWVFLGGGGVEWEMSQQENEWGIDFENGVITN